MSGNKRTAKQSKDQKLTAMNRYLYNTNMFVLVSAELAFVVLDHH